MDAKHKKGPVGSFNHSETLPIEIGGDNRL